MRTVYLDNAATTPVSIAVFNEMVPYLSDDFHNPSARYSSGRQAKIAVETAREKVAKLINAYPDEIYFTSGGTESDNWAFEIAMNPDIRGGIVSSDIEHPAIFNRLENTELCMKDGLIATTVGVDADGFVSVEDLEDIGEVWENIGSDIGFVSIMMANNEVGTIQPIKEITEFAHERAAYMHTDAVQAVGNIPIDVKELGVDMMSISSHKIGGPKGVGALYIERTVPKIPLIYGGGQESGMRGGTENVPAIVGFGKACELVGNNLDEHIRHVRELRNLFMTRLLLDIPGVDIIGTRDLTKRLPGNAAIAFKGVEAESLLMMLDADGIQCSVGSACSSNKLSPSRVLKAMGVPDELIHSVVRFSFGDSNTIDDVLYASKKIADHVAQLRVM